MSSDNDPQQGCLVIADISGYTAFLAGSELQHAQGIPDELLGDILKTLAPPFETANLEGDAVFCYAPAGRIRRRPAADRFDRGHLCGVHAHAGTDGVEHHLPLLGL